MLRRKGSRSHSGGWKTAVGKRNSTKCLTYTTVPRILPRKTWSCKPAFDEMSAARMAGGERIGTPTFKRKTRIRTGIACMPDHTSQDGQVFSTQHQDHVARVLPTNRPKRDLVKDSRAPGNLAGLYGSVPHPARVSRLGLAGGSARLAPKLERQPA